MKAFKFLMTLLFLVVSFSGYSQKVKIKKGKVLIDKVETYKMNEEGILVSFSTLTGKEFVSIVSTSYEEPNPASKMPHTGYIPPTIKKYVYTVKFLKSGKEMFTDMRYKEVIKAIHNANLVDTEGDIDEDNLDLFINKYNNENLKYKLVN